MEAPSRFPLILPHRGLPRASFLSPLSLFYPSASLAVMRRALSAASRTLWTSLLRSSMHRPVNGVHIAPPYRKNEKRTPEGRRPRAISQYIPPTWYSNSNWYREE